MVHHNDRKLTSTYHKGSNMSKQREYNGEFRVGKSECMREVGEGKFQQRALRPSIPQRCLKRQQQQIIMHDFAWGHGWP
jgi:hypothetical protein